MSGACKCKVMHAMARNQNIIFMMMDSELSVRDQEILGWWWTVQ